MKTIVAFLYFLFVFALNAQTIYPLKEATHLLLEDDFITPIKQVDSLYKGLAIKMMRTHSFVNDIVYTKELIAGRKSHLYAASQLRQLSKDDFLHTFLNREYLIEKFADNIFDQAIATIQMITPTLILHRIYANDEFYNESTQQREKGWHLKKQTYYPMIYLALSNGTIVMQDLSNGNYIIPIPEGFQINFGHKFGYKYLERCSEPFNPSAYSVIPTQQNIRLDSQNITSLLMPNGKYQIRDAAGNSVFNEFFDSVSLSEYFVVVQLGNNYKIYNSQFNLIDQADSYAIDSQKTVKLLKGNEVISKNTLGEVVPDKYTSPFKIMGNHHFSEVLTIKEMRANRYKIKRTITSWHFCVGKNRWKERYETTADNPYRIPNTKRQANCFVIEKDGKYGVGFFCFENKEAFIVPSTPVDFDKVDLQEDTTYAIRLYKNGQIYLFDKYNKTSFLSEPFEQILEQRGSFVRYQRGNGKQGWYNLKTAKCFDNK